MNTALWRVEKRLSAYAHDARLAAQSEFTIAESKLGCGWRHF